MFGDGRFHLAIIQQNKPEQQRTASNTVEVEWAGCAEDDGLLRSRWNDTEYHGHRLSELITQRSLVQIRPPQPVKPRGYGSHRSPLGVSHRTQRSLGSNPALVTQITRGLRCDRSPLIRVSSSGHPATHRRLDSPRPGDWCGRGVRLERSSPILCWGFPGATTMTGLAACPPTLEFC